MARIFFAIWPDAAAVEALCGLAGEVAGRCGGRRVPAGNLHVTLAFLGEVPEARIDAAAGVARGLRGAPFRIGLDRLGSFRKARVAWIGCDRPPPALLGLERQLVAGLTGAGFALEARPYAPHLTLARKIERAVGPEATARIEWTAGDLALVRTEFGKGKYTTLERFELRG